MDSHLFSNGIDTAFHFVANPLSLVNSNSSVLGTRYFRCARGRGVFLPLGKVVLEKKGDKTTGKATATTAR